jgi:hypothetical protein
MPTALITLVQAPGCHFCADARDALTELEREHDVRVDVVTADGEAGQALVGDHRPAMLPLVLVDGTFFSAGRLPRRKLRALLAARLPVGAS